jgi:hypothetical protein
MTHTETRLKLTFPNTYGVEAGKKELIDYQART